MSKRAYIVLLLALSLVVVVLPGKACSVSALDGFNPDANGHVYSIAVQADGTILMGGLFTTVGGVTRNRIARLHADGTLDTGFNPDVDARVYSIALQADGKILIGGDFTAIDGVTKNYIARLHADGTLDTDFNPDANNSVNSIALQADGKILIGGEFANLGGVTRNHIARLHADGTLDTDFNPDGAARVYSIALQADGKILIGGEFTAVGGVTRNCIARLHADGTLDTGFNPNADSDVASIAVQVDGKILMGGYFSTVGGVTKNYIARLNPDGTLDTDFNPDANNPVRSIALQANGAILVGGFSGIAQVNPDGTLDAGFNPNANGTVYSTAVQADGKILIGGYFSTVGGVTRNCIARLHSDGTLDTDLNPDANSSVYSIALQPDGKILIGGEFTAVGAAATTRNRIARLNADGSLDMNFDPNLTNSNPGTIGKPMTIALQPDGKIIIGGTFDTVGSTTRNYIARLNADGSLDADFNPNVDGTVNSIALQPDGKILIGGNFTTIGATPTTRNRIARLNADGSLDADFNPSANNRVYSIALQPDGKILIGGNFTTIGATPTTRNRIARLNADGSLDADFNSSANSSVLSIALQADGKILIAGYFAAIGAAGTTRKYVARLNANGSLDADFNPSASGTVYSIALQADGKILVGGNFTTIGAAGTTRNYIARLNADGSLDADFNPSASGTVYSIALQADGKILVGGNFTTIGAAGTTRNYIARLTNTDAALQELKVSSQGSAVTWLRGQANPEVGRVTFEHSSDGTTWRGLGNGTRITGGWQLTGLSLPVSESHYVRARGYAPGGIYNESVRLFYLMPSASISLATGWNFISLPVQPGSDKTCNVLSPVSSALATVWGYNNGTKTWLRYRPGDKGATLTSIDAGKGYWLYLTSPATLSVTGTTASQTVALSEGWNLVGYAGVDGKSLIDALSGISGKWSLIWGWESGQWSATLGEPGSLPVPSLLNLYQGKAYWIRVKEGAGPVEWAQ